MLLPQQLMLQTPRPRDTVVQAPSRVASSKFTLERPLSIIISAGAHLARAAAAFISRRSNSDHSQPTRGTLEWRGTSVHR